MKLILLNLLATKELIDDMLCHIQALGLETELTMHINYPLEEERTRCVSYLCLNFVDVFWINHEFEFFLFHVFKVFLRILDNEKSTWNC